MCARPAEVQVGDGPRTLTLEEALVNPTTGLPLTISPVVAAGAGAGAGSGAASAAPAAADASVEDMSLEQLAVNLVSQIQNSDWLQQNPPTGESIFDIAAREAAGGDAGADAGDADDA